MNGFFEGKLFKFLLGWFGAGLCLFFVAVGVGAAWMTYQYEDAVSRLITVGSLVVSVVCFLLIPYIIYKTYKAMRKKRVRVQYDS